MSQFKDHASAVPAQKISRQIGNVVVRERHRSGITQEVFAQHLNVTKAAVSKWEVGQSSPDITQLPRIAAFFGISTDELLGYAEKVSEEEASRIIAEVDDVLAADFDAGFTDCKTIERSHWRDWPLLCRLASLLMNHLLRHPDKSEEVAGYIDELLSRIESECDDFTQKRTVRMLWAMFLMGFDNAFESSRIDESIALLESLYNDEALAIPSLLASAYEQAARGEDSLKLRQSCVYYSGSNVVNECLAQMKHYADDPLRLGLLFRVAKLLTEALRLDALNATFALTLYSESAVAFKNAGETNRALSCLEEMRCVIDGSKGDLFSAPTVQDVPLFDAIIDEFDVAAKKDGMTGNPQSTMIIDGSIASLLANADWDDCSDDPRYRALLACRSEEFVLAQQWADKV